MNSSTSFATPIGNVMILDNGIVHVHILLMDLTKEALMGHYDIIEQRFGDEKQSFILTFEPSYLKMDASTRRYNNEMMNYWSKSMTAVVDNPLIRTFVNMYIKINTLTYPLKVSKSMKEATDWTLEQK